MDKSMEKPMEKPMEHPWKIHQNPWKNPWKSPHHSAGRPPHHSVVPRLFASASEVWAFAALSHVHVELLEVLARRAEALQAELVAQDGARGPWGERESKG